MDLLIIQTGVLTSHKSLYVTCVVCVCVCVCVCVRVCVVVDTFHKQSSLKCTVVVTEAYTSSLAYRPCYCSLGKIQHEKIFVRSQVRQKLNTR